MKLQDIIRKICRCKHCVKNNNKHKQELLEKTLKKFEDIEVDCEPV